MTDVYPFPTVPLVAYLLPRGMTREAYDALGLEVATREPRTLRPDPTVVSDAVQTLKKLGFAVTAINLTSLDISAGLGLLEAHFGVTMLPTEAGPPVLAERLANAENPSEVVAAAAPLAANPLRDLIHIVATVPRSSQPYMPLPPPDLQPNKNGLRGKLEPWHLWPDEIRLALNGFAPDDADPKLDKYRNVQGWGAQISLVDSGIDRSHPWFAPELGIPIEDRVRLSPGPQATDQLDKLRADFSLQSHLAGSWKRFVVALKGSTRATRQKGPSRFWLDPPQVAAIRTLAVNGMTIADLASASQNNDDFIGTYYRYLRYHGRASEITAFEQLHYLAQPTPHDIVEFTIDVNAALDEFSNYLDWVTCSVQTFTDWVDRIKKNELVDYDGHGTMMAVSMLSIAGHANIRATHAFYGAHAPRPFEDFIEQTETTLYRPALEAAIDEVGQPNVGAAHKIISNSWGSDAEAMEPGTPSEVARLQQEITRWRTLVALAVQKDIVVCFAVGNAGNPLHGYLSMASLTGPVGAIIVGGAYKLPAGGSVFEPGDGQVHLSSAAHAYRHAKEGIFPEKDKVPDICGLVGPLLMDINEKEGDWVSPYVYLPANNSTWRYYGGGTSSACAQIAGICALVRARYPNFSAADVKALVRDNGQAVEKGESYNRKTSKNAKTVDTSTDPRGPRIAANDFAPRLKLVSIRDVIKVADAKARKLKLKPAAGRP